MRPAGDASVDWWAEIWIAGAVTAFAALFGALVGVVWHAVAPRIHIVAAAQGSSAAMKPLIGDDLWLGVLGVAAGIICVALLILVAPHASKGPGAQLGLAVGGALGMLVAARVGHLIGHRDLTALIKSNYPTAGPSFVSLVLSYFDFKVRLTGVLLSWPFVSVLLSVFIVGLRTVNQPTMLVVPTYPVSP
jgi:hypothetical protein